MTALPFAGRPKQEHSARASSPRVWRHTESRGAWSFPVLLGEENQELSPKKLDPGEKYERDQRARLMLDADIDFALKAERGGAGPMFERKDMVKVGLVTGAVVAPDPLRRVNCLELVQARHHHDMHDEFQAFMLTLGRRAAHVRYQVMTSGTRIGPDDDLGARISDINRKIYKLQRHAARKYQVEYLLTVAEFTWDKDDRSLHYHVNALVLPHRFLGPRPKTTGEAQQDTEWQSYLRDCWRILGNHWQDNGPVQKLREVLKYCLKAADRDAMDDVTAAWIVNGIKRRRMVIPRNSFRDFRRWLVDRDCKAHVITDPHDGRRRGFLVPRSHRAPAAGSSGRRAAHVVGVTRPHCGATCYAEPYAVVRLAGAPAERWRDHLDPRDADALAPIERAALAAWQQAGHPPAPVAMAQAAAITGAQNVDEAQRCVVFQDPRAGAEYRVHTTQLTFTAEPPEFWAANDDRATKPPD